MGADESKKYSMYILDRIEDAANDPGQSRRTQSIGTGTS